MTESEVVNEWISLGEAKGILAERRRNLLEIIHGRFPGEAPEEVVRLIQEQESLGLLQDWLRAAWRVATFEKFLDVLKR